MNIFITIEIHDVNDIMLFFLMTLMVLLPATKFSLSFLVCFCWYLKFFCLFFSLAGSIILLYGGADFKSLILDFLGQEKSLAVIL